MVFINRCRRVNTQGPDWPAVQLMKLQEESQSRFAIGHLLTKPCRIR